MKRFSCFPAVIFCSFFWSCSTEAALQQILSSSVTAPVFLGCKAVSSEEIDFQFDKPVKVSSVHFDPPLEFSSVIDGKTVQLILNQKTGPGERITANILVEDMKGNTLNVLVPFRTRNDRIPNFHLTEIRTEYSKPKVEFVELKISGAGNLGALRLFAASNGIEEALFEFPPAEVKAGEYVVVHLRSLGDGRIDETGADLDAAFGDEALAGVRDFWVPLAAEKLRKTDAVLILDQDDKVIDGVMICESPAPASWAKEGLHKAAELLSAQGAWLPAGSKGVPAPADAVISTGTTLTRTICRDESIADSNRASDWYIVTDRGATPGKPNNPARYTPK